ncbi:hypothetical protein J4558_03640 [Leptolyngbya sp. 15MV]|nr:hypothetical protein J4558_03640 [Leptolyngbya sp. 15MV]
MRVILSRKGFDTGSGGAASPIIAGRPTSLPIPTGRRSRTSYADLGLGETVERVTRGKIARGHLCHEDPMFVGDECYFGQCSAAQSHLRNQGVGVGDVFLFFGLFADEHTGERHHRIFGYLRVAELLDPAMDRIGPLARPHPHTIGEWNSNNTIYRGLGRTASSDDPALRLTQAGGPLRHWRVPAWLRSAGLSYHGKPERWLGEGKLEVVSRGQEFVTDIGTDAARHEWLNRMIEAIER